MIAVPYLWLVVLFLVPFIIVFKISFSESRMAMPPYAPLIEWRDGVIVGIKLYFSNYRFLFTDRLYISAYLYSLKVAAVSTLWCLVIGYPMTYAIALVLKAIGPEDAYYKRLFELRNTWLVREIGRAHV